MTLLLMTMMRRLAPSSAVFGGIKRRYVSNDASKYVRVIDDSLKQTRRVVMCNDKQRNALGLEMIRALQESVSTVDTTKCRVLILSSAQTNVFSAGHNLKEFTAEAGRQLHEQVFSEFTRLCLSLRDLSVPTIAEVYGLAAAAGCQLAASCDLVVASQHAAFSTPGVKFGVFCSTPGVPLARNLSPKLSAKMLFTGLPLSAKEALAHGLVSDLVDPCPDQQALEQRVDVLAAQIVANSRGIVALGKSCFYKQLERPDLKSAYEVASRAMLDNLTYEDTQSGLKAFAQKKKPVWSHSDKKCEVN